MRRDGTTDRIATIIDCLPAIGGLFLFQVTIMSQILTFPRDVVATPAMLHAAGMLTFATASSGSAIVELASRGGNIA